MTGLQAIAEFANFLAKVQNVPFGAHILAMTNAPLRNAAIITVTWVAKHQTILILKEVKRRDSRQEEV